MNPIFQNDIRYMKRCFSLAKKGQGKVSPNPLVGAVIVKNNQIIGEGWHKKYGQAHAEVNAFFDAKSDVAGSTLYVNLEPCCHRLKNTPPCVPLIISKKIKRVVICNEDPNPQVAGKGIAQLRSDGIEVDSGILNSEGHELNRFYFKFIKSGMPYVILKIAQSMDGKIGITNQEQKWLTGEKSKRFVHKMRALCDGVLIGANTVRVDNPQLSVREARGRNPVRIIIDGNLSIPVSSSLFKKSKQDKKIIFTSKGSEPAKSLQLKSEGIDLVELEAKDKGEIDLYEVLEILGKRKIMSLIVEGGQSIFSQFIRDSLFDEIIILQAPVMLGNGISPSLYAMKSRLIVKEITTLGEDVKIILRNKL